jgi:hypothetical protein
VAHLQTRRTTAKVCTAETGENTDCQNCHVLVYMAIALNRKKYEFCGCYRGHTCMPYRDTATLGRDDTLAQRYEQWPDWNRSRRLDMKWNWGGNRNSAGTYCQNIPNWEITHWLSTRHWTLEMHCTEVEQTMSLHKKIEAQEAIDICDVLLPVRMQVWKVPHRPSSDLCWRRVSTLTPCWKKVWSNVASCPRKSYSTRSCHTDLIRNWSVSHLRRGTKYGDRMHTLK